MRRTMILLILVSLLVFGLAVPAFANGASDTAQLHPGHQGVLSSGAIHGIPSIHFHAGVEYDTGPGGWGSAVSTAARTYKGLPNAHAG